MNIIVSAEQLCAEKMYLLRTGPKHYAFGDPYIFSGVMIVTGTQGEVIGACGKLNIPKIKECARSLGVTCLVWDRIKDGVKTRHRREL